MSHCGQAKSATSVAEVGYLFRIVLQGATLMVAHTDLIIQEADVAESPDNHKDHPCA